MNVDWPDYEQERLSGLLLRVDLQERRLLVAGDWPGLVDHLIRSASVACLAREETEAKGLVWRAGQRVVEWTGQVQNGLPRSTYNHDFSLVRGVLLLQLSSTPELRQAMELVAAQTAGLPPGPAHNARLICLAFLGRYAELPMAAAQSSMEDTGLGPPLRRFIMAICTRDRDALRSAVDRWLREKMEATQTIAWGDYNEVPLEVSGALALAERCGCGIRVRSNRVWPAFREDPAA